MSEMDLTTPTHYGAAMEMVDALCEEVRRLRERQGAALAEIDRLTAALDETRAIIDGSTIAPTDEEAFAHQRAGGSWLADFVGAIGVLWTTSHAGVRGWRGISDPPRRWWALDQDRRPCAWPKVTP